MSTVRYMLLAVLSVGSFGKLEMTKICLCLRYVGNTCPSAEHVMKTFRPYASSEQTLQAINIKYQGINNTTPSIILLTKLVRVFFFFLRQAAYAIH